MSMLLAIVLAVSTTLPQAASAGPGSPAQGVPAAQGRPSALRDVAFMVGRWVGGEGGDLSEEVWTEPSGDTMLGMWRYVAGGSARVLEILVLRQEGDDVVLRLRHFDAQLVAREDKETPLVLRLVRRQPNEARFEGPAVGTAGTVAITYRQVGADALESTVERGGKTQRFAFTRRPSP